MRASYFVLLGALVLAASCASAPPAGGPRTNAVSAPEWTTRSIFMEGSNLVFVVSGPPAGGFQELAYSAMAAYLDLPLTPETPLVAAQAVEKFLKGMSLTKPSDQFSRDGKDFWKIAVPKAEWDQARTQLKVLWDQNVDPSVVLERAAAELLRQGRYVDAASGYVAAAASALEGGSVSRYRSNLSQAQQILSQFTFSSPTPALVTRVGQPFPSSFLVRLTYGSGADAPPVAGAPLRFNYKAKKNGRIAVTGQTVKTDADGRVVFDLPVPDFAVRDSLVVLYDVTPWIEALALVPAGQKDAVTGLETLAADRRIQLPYAVESASKQVPMIVSLADFDDKGSVQRRQESSAALITALQKAGFQASGIPVNPNLLKSSNENVILAAWKFQGKTTGRAVYGTVNLVSVTASGSQFTAEVSGTLRVTDLATSKLVLQLKTSKAATANDRASAITAAYRQWAVEAGEQLESDLP